MWEVLELHNVVLFSLVKCVMTGSRFSNWKFMKIWIFRTTEHVVFSSGVNHSVTYKVMIFQFRKYLAKNVLVKITLIFLGNQDEEIIS